MSNYTPPPIPEQEAAAKAMLEAIYAKSMQPHRRLWRWVRRYVLAYPLFAVLAIGQLVKRWWQGRCSAFGRGFWSFRGSGRVR